MHSKQFDPEISQALDYLGIPYDLILQKNLPYHAVAQTLVLAETSYDGKEHLLVPQAAIAWNELKMAAQQDGIILEIVSAFRSIDDQIEIIQEKLARAMPMDTILTLSAPPGFSEHHTGRAIDINTPGCEPREEPFENTPAFRWLLGNASQFGFALSYPRGNQSGFIYEPWHWLFRDYSDH
jgi:D-alanyl-D-alanine carboxypeptidase